MAPFLLAGPPTDPMHAPPCSQGDAFGCVLRRLSSVRNDDGSFQYFSMATNSSNRKSVRFKKWSKKWFDNSCTYIHVCISKRFRVPKSAVMYSYIFGLPNFLLYVDIWVHVCKKLSAVRRKSAVKYSNVPMY